LLLRGGFGLAGGSGGLWCTKASPEPRSSPIFRQPGSRQHHQSHWTSQLRRQETALRALARIRAEDKDAFASIRRALTALAGQLPPDQAVPWGGSGIYRLHVPGIRILYEVDEDAVIIYVINVAVTP